MFTFNVCRETEYIGFIGFQLYTSFLETCFVVESIAIVSPIGKVQKILQLRGPEPLKHLPTSSQRIILLMEERSSPYQTAVADEVVCIYETTLLSSTSP